MIVPTTQTSEWIGQGQTSRPMVNESRKLEAKRIPCPSLENFVSFPEYRQGSTQSGKACLQCTLNKGAIYGHAPTYIAQSACQLCRKGPVFPTQPFFPSAQNRYSQRPSAQSNYLHTGQAAQISRAGENEKSCCQRSQAQQKSDEMRGHQCTTKWGLCAHITAEPTLPDAGTKKHKNLSKKVF